MTKPYIKASAFNYWSKIIKEKICPPVSGMEDFSFYTFRKTHISMMSNFLTELVLIKHTGHAKIDTIRKYYANRTETTDKLILDGVRQTGSEIESFLSHSKSTRTESTPDHYYETDLEIEFETQSIPPAIPVDDEDGEDIIF